MLHLGQNYMGFECAEEIANMLNKKNTLTVLHIGFNNIDFYGTKVIAAALKNNNTLTVFDLSNIIY